MRSFFYTLLIASFAAIILHFILPWWSAALAGGIAGYFVSKSKFTAFWACFIVMFLVWTGGSIYLHDDPDDLLLNRISELYSLPGKVYLYFISGTIGGIAGGLGGFTGYLAAQIYHPNKKSPTNTSTVNK